jgi:DNA-binding NtrC family response regulator
VVSGPDVGKEHLLKKGLCVVGQSRDCDLVLTDRAVSRRHASIALLPGGVRVTDMESKNGLRHRRARVTSADLPLGADIQLGHTALTFLPVGPARGASPLGLATQSLSMRRLARETEHAAASDGSVLIVGETGSGKELVARSLHAQSKRAAGPFQVFDCAAGGGELVASALFGHVRGAFTGAVAERVGAFAAANGGTLFFDEIAALPLEVQAMLLRAVESRRFCRVGERVESSSNFRLVASTHADLEAAVAKGAFRQDLYFRLTAIVLRVPPLRERIEDIPELVANFAAEADRELPLHPALLAALCAHRWPGNVRELKNAVERGLVLGSSALFLPRSDGERNDFKQAREAVLRGFERGSVEFLLSASRGSPARAARMAGLTRSYFYELMQKYGVLPHRARARESS